MPVMRCKNGGYKWGQTGKCVSTRAQAEKIGRESMKKKGGKRGGKRK